MNSVLRSWYKTITTTFTLSLFSALKISKIAGFKFSSFSLTQAIAPVAACELSHAEFAAATFFRTLFYMLLHPAGAFFALLHHAPSYVGAVYFKSMLARKSFIAQSACVAAPLACIALFISSPVGASALVYSFFWLIPAAIGCIPHRSIFLTALASTFMTHAVGTLLFIFAFPTTAAFWIALIPVVIIERTLFAFGTTALYYGFEYAKYRLTTPEIQQACA